MAARIAILTVCLAVLTLSGAHSDAQAVELPSPAAPLALAGGEAIDLAWSLPPGVKPETVVILRSGKDAAGLAEVARVPASDLRWTDSDFTLGQTYEYRVQTLKGAKKSGISEPATVLVGGTARITFLGGSTERALFEVSIFRRGRRVAAQFVHKPGDKIGDLAYVPDLDSVEDFRLGPTLLKLSISVAEARETASETLKTSNGEPMLDLAGSEIQIEFTYPGATKEVVVAYITDAAGQPQVLMEGEAFKTD